MEPFEVKIDPQILFFDPHADAVKAVRAETSVVALRQYARDEL